jgi:hypothetical protein
MRINASSSTTRRLACFAGCASVAKLHPFAGTGTFRHMLSGRCSGFGLSAANNATAMSNEIFPTSRGLN